MSGAWGACETCSHFDKLTQDGGLCRRYAPRPKSGRAPRLDGTDEHVACVRWPYVDADDRCGEYNPKRGTAGGPKPEVIPVQINR